MSQAKSNPIILYDGVCGLCNRLVQFVLQRDKHDVFRFASLQSELAGALLKRHGKDAADLDTVYVVLDYDHPAEGLLARSDAILFLLRELGGFWRMAILGKIFPRFLRDLFYKFVARNRYKVFGRLESCMLPEPGQRGKFLDQ